MIEVTYYGALTEAQASPFIYSGSANTPLELYDELHQAGNLSIARQALRVAVNDEFVGWDHALHENDRVAFMPPMAGG